MIISHDAKILGGEPRIDGTRISVLHIYDQVVAGNDDPASVADALDLTLGQVYEALAYYYNNPDEMRLIREHRDKARSDVLERVVKPPIEANKSG